MRKEGISLKDAVMLDYIMSKLEVGETNKLLGFSNYYVWSLKMRALLQKEVLWRITEEKLPQIHIQHSSIDDTR